MPTDIPVFADTPVKTIITTDTPISTDAPTEAPTPTISPGTLKINAKDGAFVAYIPEGSFIMGIYPEQAAYLESICDGFCKAEDFSTSQPAHEVMLDEFLIYKTEVSNEMYAACVNSGSCLPPASNSSETRADYYNNPVYNDYPVVHVDWYSANDYCIWAGGRLPTEAEWEKAARGTTRNLFPWGDNPPTTQLANNNNRIGDTMPVESYPSGASPYGVLNMTGNVWEWTADWYEEDYYTYSPSKNPQGPSSSSRNQRVGRGGSWGWNDSFSSIIYHDWWEPFQVGSGVGFRCVIEITVK